MALINPSKIRSRIVSRVGRLALWSAVSGVTSISILAQDCEKELIDQGYLPVSSAQNLRFLEGSEANYVLTQDIDLADADFEPISSFSGTLEGCQHEVQNLHVYGNDVRGFALFLQLEPSAIVQNLIVRRPMLFGRSALAPVAVTNLGQIENVHVLGGVIAGYRSTGGLVVENGWANSDLGVVSRSSSSAQIIYNPLNIQSIPLSFDHCNHGGLIGTNYGLVRESTASGSVTGLCNIGGLIGKDIGGRIDGSIATGLVRVDAYIPNSNVLNLLNSGLTQGSAGSLIGFGNRVQSVYLPNSPITEIVSSEGRGGVSANSALIHLQYVGSQVGYWGQYWYP